MDIPSARRIQQRGGNRAAVNGAAENTQQHHDAGIAVQLEGKGQHDGQAHGRGHTGHSADENAQDRTAQNDQHIDRSENSAESK